MHHPWKAVSRLGGAAFPFGGTSRQGVPAPIKRGSGGNSMIGIFLVTLVFASILIACNGTSMPPPTYAPASTPTPAATDSAAPAALPEPTIKTSGKPIFISAPGKPGITVQKHNAGYHDVYELVGGDGSHDVSQQRWQQVMDILGWGVILPKKRKIPAGASNGTTGKRSNPLGTTWTQSLETA